MLDDTRNSSNTRQQGLETGASSCMGSAVEATNNLPAPPPKSEQEDRVDLANAFRLAEA